MSFQDDVDKRWERWMRVHQSRFAGGALEWFERGDEQSMWYCLLQWAYHKDIADTMCNEGETDGLPK